MTEFVWKQLTANIVFNIDLEQIFDNWVTLEITALSNLLQSLQRKFVK